MQKVFCAILRIFAIVVAVIISSWSSAALEFEAQYTDNRPLFPPALWIDMTGEVKAGDTARFLKLIQAYADRDIYEVVLRLDNPGGSLIESLRLGRAISKLPYTTQATVGVEGEPQICASACVNVYLGADYRFLTGAGRIGVHRFSMSGTDIGADEALSISQDLSAQIIEYIRAMRADPGFFNIMVSTHSDDIYWVPRGTLEELRVVTGGIYDETAEYRNVNGSIALYLSQVSRVGTNTLTLICGKSGLVGIVNLNEPELTMMGRLELHIDGSSIPLDDFEIVERDNYRLKALSLFPISILQRLTNARELGARVTSPEAGIFFGFEGGVRDSKIAETARGCLATLEAGKPQMTRADGIDLTGGDLTQSGHRDVSFAECQNICLSDNRCIAVSYVISRRWCWPKSHISTTKQNPSVVSAFRE